MSQNSAKEPKWDSIGLLTRYPNLGSVDADSERFPRSTEPGGHQSDDLDE